MNVAKNIAAYLRANPNTYLFIEGHCDERQEAYNLALIHRANAVRNLLIQEGVNPNHIFTIFLWKRAAPCIR